MRKLVIVLIVAMFGVVHSQDQKVNRISDSNTYIVNVEYSSVAGDNRVIKAYRFDNDLEGYFDSSVKSFVINNADDSMTDKIPSGWKESEGYSRTFHVFERQNSDSREVVIIRRNILNRVIFLYHQIHFYKNGNLVDSAESLYVPSWADINVYWYRMNLDEWRK